MSADVWNFRDVLDALVDVRNDDRSKNNERKARRAILEAYRDLPPRRHWAYYYRQMPLATVPSQTAGSIQYTQSSRQMTLTDATWPSWIESGDVMVNQNPYPVEQRVSDTVIILSASVNPGADIASGTPYCAYQDTYSLPTDFTAAGALVNTTNLYIPVYTHPSELIETTRLSGGPTVPRCYSFLADPRVTDGLALRFAPPPNAVYQYQISCQRRPRPLAIDQYSTGTVSVTAGDTTVTGSGTAFTAAMAGSLMRFSADGSTLPTNAVGSLDNLNPAAFAGVIQSFTNGTSLKLQQPAPMSLSAVLFTISDPIEIETGAMFTAFMRLAELNFARAWGADAGEMADRNAEFENALQLAAAADDRSFANDAITGYRPWPPLVNFSTPQVIP